MRHFLPLLLLGPLALTSARAFSQVSVDQRALPPPAHADSASPPAAATPAAATPAPQAEPPAGKPAAQAGKPSPHSGQKAPAEKPAPKSRAGKAANAKPGAARPATPRPAPPAPGTPQVRLGLTPPAAPVIPPAIPVPVRPPLPPAPAPVVADAAGAATTLAPEHIAGEKDAGGLRITFGPGSADLNPATDAALRALAHSAPPQSRFTVDAFAAGIPEDPSTPRRTSLSRALAVRSVLIAEGIASERIIVRALGAPSAAGAQPPADQAPADRTDIAILPPIGGETPAPQPTASQ